MVADVHIIDDVPPEAVAMLQALYSRSSDSVLKHLEKVHSSGPDDFMKRYYVGYGHESIGDCGTTYIFIETVSILAAKAIEDWPLYSGQETSTRYINFAKQPVLNYLPFREAKIIQNNWISFYNNSYLPLVDYLMAVYPKAHTESQSKWELAIDAHAFDILRGFLPAGVTTQLSWATNLRQANDKLKLLRYHPLQEVRDLANLILNKLTDKYPSSFAHKQNEEEEEYIKANAMAINYYSARTPIVTNLSVPFAYVTNINNQKLEENELGIISKRPRKAALPRHLRGYGSYQCQFLLDFGSFRDLHRHRNGLCQIPILDSRYGFNKWYLEGLPNKLREAAEELIESQYDEINALKHMYGLDDVALQYLYPLGTNVCVELTYSLPEMVYVTELRSGQSVHPTLRKIAHFMHNALKKQHPNLALYTNLLADEWSTKRGSQTITEIKND